MRSGVAEVGLDESGRRAHLAGKVGRALIANTPTLIEGLPRIEHAKVLAFKR